MTAPNRPDIVLYTAATMNGWKPIIFLEEAEVPYELVPIDLSKNEQHEPWYVDLNPNGRIPTIVDRGNDDFVVFESGAILWYLAEKYGRFLPKDARSRSLALQWIMFQVSGVGPMMGQAMYFQRVAAPKGQRDDFAIQRYVAESRRLLEVVDRRLADRDYLLGDEYSIADMAMYPYARSHPWAKVSIDGLDNLRRWFLRLDGRLAIRRAVSRPKPFPEAFGQGNEAVAEQEDAAPFGEAEDTHPD
jgi:GSH-dependent disulfide-bond oxidoreductase